MLRLLVTAFVFGVGTLGTLAMNIELGRLIGPGTGSFFSAGSWNRTRDVCRLLRGSDRLLPLVDIGVTGRMCVASMYAGGGDVGLSYGPCFVGAGLLNATEF